MQIMQRLSQFKNVTKDDKIVLLVTGSMFLPFYISIIVLLGSLLYLIKEKRLIQMIRSTPRANYAIVFCVLTGFVALFQGNYLGAGCAVGILAIFLFMFYCRNVIHKSLLKSVLDLCCILSLGCVIYALIEYIVICNRLNFDILSLKVANAPENRIHASFFNANYYAMMLEFVILICVYKVMQFRYLKQAVWYVFVALCNMFILYLTGCRTAWVPFLISVPFMFFINKRYGYLSLSLTAIAGGIGVLYLKPALFQRMTLAKDFAKRTRIWETAIKGIQAHPVLGEGPLTYFHIYEQYGGHPTQHAHNILLDPILSHGIVGVLILGVYLGSNLKQVWKLFQSKIDVPLFTLIGAFIITVFLHGMLDYTVYWIQTGFLFLFILSSSSMYFQTSK